MRKNKAIKKQMEMDCGVRLRELCEILNPPEYRRKDFRNGQTISVGKLPNFVLNEIRQKRLKTTIIDRKVRIEFNDYLQWTLIG